MHSADYWQDVRLSVRPSVAYWYSVSTVIHILKVYTYYTYPQSFFTVG